LSTSGVGAGDGAFVLKGAHFFLHVSGQRAKTFLLLPLSRNLHLYLVLFLPTQPQSFLLLPFRRNASSFVQSKVEEGVGVCSANDLVGKMPFAAASCSWVAPTKESKAAAIENCNRIYGIPIQNQNNLD